MFAQQLVQSLAHWVCQDPEHLDHYEDDRRGIVCNDNFLGACADGLGDNFSCNKDDEGAKKYGCPSRHEGMDNDGEGLEGNSIGN